MGETGDIDAMSARLLPFGSRTVLTYNQLFSIFLFIGLASVYFATMCPTIYVNDSADVAVAAVRLEIAHPPGYPLLTILGHCWSGLLWFLRPIFALNLFSVLLTAIAGTALFRLLDETFGDKSVSSMIGSFSVALMFGFGQTVWAAATAFEAYSLAVVLDILALYALLRFRRSVQVRWLLLGCYLLSLAIGNHYSSLALLPLATLVFYEHRRRINLKVGAFAILVAIIGLSVCIYLPIRSTQDLVLDWMNPESLNGFIGLVSAKIYRMYISVPHLSDMLPYARAIWRVLVSEYTLPIFLLALPGIVVLWRRERRLTLALLLALSINLFLNSAYVIKELEWFHLPSLIVIALFLVVGLRELFVGSVVWRMSGIAIGVALVLIPLLGNFATSDLSKRDVAERYGMELLQALPPNATLICGSDFSQFPALYLHYVEGIRPDCKVYGPTSTDSRLQSDLGIGHRDSNLEFPELLSRLLNSARVPVCFSHDPMQIDSDLGTIYAQSPLSGLYTSNNPEVPAAQRATASWRPAFPVVDPGEIATYSTLGLLVAEKFATTDTARSNSELAGVIDYVVDSDCLPLFGSLSTYLLYTNRFEQARKLLTASLSHPDLRYAKRLELLNALGQSYIVTNEPVLAESVFTMVTSEQPGDSAAQYMLAVSRAMQAEAANQLETAIEYLRESLRYRAIAPEINFQLGLLHLRLADTTKALQMFDICDRYGFQPQVLSRIRQSVAIERSGNGSNTPESMPK